MRAKLVSIGNSRGIRLPKVLVEQYGLDKGIELEPAEDHLIVRAARGARVGWDAAFQRMNERGDDRLLDGPSAEAVSEWDRQEWTW